jgi:predicted HD phosphohydrolase
VLQGGAMSDKEIKEFEKNDYLDQCINLRYWDDQAKDPKRKTPSFSYYRPIIESLINK